jgi:lysophospholipase L1-like esterase
MSGRRALRPQRHRATSLLVAAVVALVAGGSTTAIALVRHRASSSASASARANATAPRAGAARLAADSPPSSAAASSGAPATASPAPSSSAPPPPTVVPTPTPVPSTPAGPYRVVGLGDSVPAGSECGCTSYVTLTADALAEQSGRSADVHNLAVGGMTTPGVVAQLNESAVRDEIAEADLVIVTIGANDFDPGVLTSAACEPLSEMPCYQSVLADQREELSSILTEVGGLQASHGGRTVVTGYWNVFLDGDVGRSQGSDYVEASDALTLLDNALIESVGTAHGATYVDIYRPFKGDGSVDDTDLLAADGDHPNASGHRLIAQTLVSALT